MSIQVKKGADTSALQKQAATGDAKLDKLIGGLAQAQSLGAIGEALRDLSGALSGDYGAVAPAFAKAMDNRPGGVRPLMADVDADNAKLFCGEATPNGVKKMARDAGVPLGSVDFKIFSTGDPFTFLGVAPDAKAGIKAEPEDVRNKTVYVIQGDAGYTPAGDAPKYDQATLVAEALQVAYAAKTQQVGAAKKAIVVFPDTLDPAKHPDNQFAQLVSRLAKASGVDEVRYHGALNSRSTGDATIQRDVRAGLPALGPKTAEVGKWMDTLAGAQSLQSVQRALAQIDMALTGLKGKYPEQSQAYAQRMASVLTDKVNQLVPGLPKGVAGIQDNRTVVFAGQSNPDLSEDIAHAMGAKLGESAVQFDGGAPFVSLGSDVAGKPAVIVQTTRQDPYTAPEDKHSAMALLTEALLLCDQAQKAGASDTTLVLPYMPSARSDKQDQRGVGTYAGLVARWVDELQLGKVVLVEPHDVHVPNYFRTPVRVLSGAAVLSQQALKDLGREDLVLVRPDEGATKRTKQLAKDLALPMVNGEKSRSDNNERANVEGLGSKSDVEGKVCLVNDDEIATGGTMRQTIGMLKENGAKEVHIAVAHANMPVEPDKRHAAMRALRDAGAQSLYLLDTQPVGKVPADLQDFVKVVSVAAAIAEEA